jgi:hypothetical protein
MLTNLFIPIKDWVKKLKYIYINEHITIEFHILC